MRLRASWVIAALLMAAAAYAAPGGTGLPAGVQCMLSGDGRSTLRSSVDLQNTTAAPVSFTMQAGTVFTAEGRQPLMLAESRAVTLPARGKARSTVTTLCVGDPKAPPAQETPAAYQANPPGTNPAAAAALQYLAAAAELKKTDKLPALPLAPALVVPTVAQLCLWTREGTMSRQSLRESVLLQLGLTAESATPEQEKEVDQGLDNILQAVDFTRKKAEKP